MTESFISFFQYLIKDKGNNPLRFDTLPSLYCRLPEKENKRASIISSINCTKNLMLKQHTMLAVFMVDLIVYHLACLISYCEFLVQMLIKGEKSLLLQHSGDSYSNRPYTCTVFVLCKTNMGYNTSEGVQ